MNGIGGFKKVTLFFADQVTVSTSAYSASLTGDAGILLPISDGKSSITSTSKGDGSYDHVAELSLKFSGVDDTMARQLRQVFCRGCVLKAEDFDGGSWLLGDCDYPLSGTADQHHGTSHSDLRHWRLRLSSVCLHPMLRIQ